MRVGVVILPEVRWRVAVRRWRRAEELGFDHAWTYDHLSWRAFQDSAWFAAIPTLTAAAVATSRIRLGTLVASPNFRHPVPFAKELITLDDISGGRITLGVGAGGSGHDAATVHRPVWSAQERAGRFEEFVELLDRLLREPVTTIEGRYYSAYEARNQPGCVQQERIPFAVAATGPRGMRLAARYGEAWVAQGDVPGSPGTVPYQLAVPVLREQSEKLEAACAEVGRDPKTLSRLLLTGTRISGVLASFEAFQDACGRFAELGFGDVVVHWPRAGQPFAARMSVLERIAAEILPKRRAGIGGRKVAEHMGG